MAIPPEPPPPYGDELELYRYQSLPSDSIRVYQIRQADSFDQQISGKLVTLKLKASGTSQRYNALSYCWGPTHADGSHLSDWILCNGRKLRVTSNLKLALKHVRAYGEREEVRIIEDD